VHQIVIAMPPRRSALRVDRKNAPSKPVNKLPEVADSIFCQAVMSTGASSLPNLS